MVSRAGSRTIDVSRVASAQFEPRRGERAVVSIVDGWTIHEYAVVTSTNLVAANLPAWTAVRAATQTNGRGRFQRPWVSDEGGLWLSAVVPSEPDIIKRRTLPLAVGLAVCDSLREMGIPELRMRWPNDVLVGDRKLAGLLIDHFSPGVSVIGIGINVRNQPEALDADLKNHTTRLVDLVPAPGNPAFPGELDPSTRPTGRGEVPECALELHKLTTRVLRHVRLVVSQLQKQGSMSLLLRVNKLWSGPRRVELDLDGRYRGGRFTGVDEEGRLALSDEAGNVTFYDAHEVRHLTET